MGSKLKEGDADCRSVSVKTFEIVETKVLHKHYKWGGGGVGGCLC